MTNFNIGMEPQGPDTKRLLLAVVLSSGVLLLYSLFFAKEAPSPSPEKNAPSVSAQNEGLKLEAFQPKAEPAHEELMGPARATPSNVPVVTKEFRVVASKKNEPSPLRSDYDIKLSSKGAGIEQFVLKDFRNPVVLVDRSKDSTGFFSLVSRSKNISLDENAHYETLESGDRRMVFALTTPEGVTFKRTYELFPNALVKESILIRNDSKKERLIDLDLRLSSDEKQNQSSGFFSTVQQGLNMVCKTPSERHHFSLGDLEKESKLVSGPVSYAAFDEQYFLKSLIPAEGGQIKSCAFSLKKNIREKMDQIQINLSVDGFTLAPGGSRELSHSLFLGPKQVNLLGQVGDNLVENIDFGWFGILSRPMLWLLVQIYQFVKNYGLAIMIITFLIKVLTFPLTRKSFVSAQEMKKIAPEIKALQKKYAHDRTLLGQKQMELYREKGINPMAGCLPLLIQMPIWFAFYQMLRSSVELYDQPFYLWIHDLTLPDPYYVMPILMGVSMLIQQWFQPMPDDQPQMKYMMWAMPIFLTFIMLNMPSGLSLYILTNNILTIIQQIFMKKKWSGTMITVS